MQRQSFPQHKTKIVDKFLEYFTTYNQVIIVDIVNIATKQINATKKHVAQTGGRVIIGKNNLAILAIKILSDERNNKSIYKKYFDKYERKPELAKLKPLIVGKIGFIFAEDNYAKLKKIVESEVIQMPAKAKVFAPCNVWIKCMNTNIDPGQINEFQNLGIQVKTVKGSLEIIKDFLLVKKGDLVDETQAAMCKKLNIIPFEYSMNFLSVMKNGVIIPQEALQIDQQMIIDSFKSTVQAFTGLSLQANLPNKISVPHQIKNTFKNLMAVGMSADYQFEQLVKAISASKNAAAAAVVVAPKAQKVEQKKEEAPVEEEADIDLADMFG